MPTYEYHCPTCKKNFDLFQTMSEAPLKKCPSCKKPVTRLIGAGAGFMFKGTGFYQTDYKRGPKPPDKPADKPADKPTEKPADKPVDKGKNASN